MSEGIKQSGAKKRENERQARYFSDDIEQPWDKKGRRNAKFERIYGKKLKLMDEERGWN